MKLVSFSPRRAALCMLAVCLTLLAACSPIIPSPIDGQGTISVTGNLENHAAVELVEARLIVTRGKHTFEKTAAIQDDQFSATLHIPIGIWDLTVLLIDAEGIVRFQSSNQSIEVQPNRPETIELSLGPADCLVTLEIELEHYVFQENVHRARVYFGETMYELLREDSTQRLMGQFNVSPGSYDFKVELYTESFRIGDRIAPGVWELLEIPITEELHLTWNPITEQIQISGTVYIPPPAPNHVTVQHGVNGITVSWEPSQDPYVTGYFVFVQTDPFEKFQLLNPIPITEPLFSHTLEELELKTPVNEIRYTVAAVGSNGYVGFRSKETVLRLEPQQK